MTEPEIVAEMARELQAKEPMGIVLAPPTVIQLTGIIQLAMRHPGLRRDRDVYAAAERFLGAVREYFADCPATLDVIRRGDDPAQDVERT